MSNDKIIIYPAVMTNMTIEQVILMLLQVVLFKSASDTRFQSDTVMRPFFLFRHPRIFIQNVSMQCYSCGACCDCSNLTLVPLPVGVKTGVILLAISPVAITAPHNMLALRGKPGLCLFLY